MRAAGWGDGRRPRDAAPRERGRRPHPLRGHDAGRRRRRLHRRGVPGRIRPAPRGRDGEGAPGPSWSSASAIGPDVTAHSVAYAALPLLGVIAIAYLIRAHATRPWYEKKLIDTENGRLAESLSSAQQATKRPEGNLRNRERRSERYRAASVGASCRPAAARPRGRRRPLPIHRVEAALDVPVSFALSRCFASSLVSASFTAAVPVP